MKFGLAFFATKDLHLFSIKVSWPPTEICLKQNYGYILHNIFTLAYLISFSCTYEIRTLPKKTCIYILLEYKTLKQNYTLHTVLHFIFTLAYLIFIFISCSKKTNVVYSVRGAKYTSMPRTTPACRMCAAELKRTQ